MSQTSFIIFEKSYIKRLGLISLFKEINESQILGDYSSVDRFSSIIKSIKPNLVIVNKELLTEISSQILNHLFVDYSFILVEISDKQGGNVLSDIENKLFYNSEKSEILNKVNQIAVQISGSIKKEERQNKEISEREKVVLACVAKGLTNKEIAEELFISTHTVITHRKNIVRKLGIKTVSGLTVYAILHKIIDMSDLQ